MGIAFAFGFALVAMAYAIGPISGCHINPAVSVGVFTAGRMSRKDLVGYLVGQILGGVAGAIADFSKPVLSIVEFFKHRLAMVARQ